jgi:hypothetical protein
MEGPVVLRSGVRALSRAVARANGRERERETCRPESMPAPVEMRLQEFGDRRRFDRWPGSGRRRHSGGGAYCKVRMMSEGQYDDEGGTASECPQVTGPPTHQYELNRNHRCAQYCSRACTTRPLGFAVN